MGKAETEVMESTPESASKMITVEHKTDYSDLGCKYEYLKIYVDGIYIGDVWAFKHGDDDPIKVRAGIHQSMPIVEDIVQVDDVSIYTKVEPEKSEVVDAYNFKSSLKDDDEEL